MGKKLGAAFIIYGIINLIASIAFLFTNNVIVIVGLAGIIWSVILIAIGKWMRRRATAQEFRDSQTIKQTDALERMADRLEERSETKKNDGK
ncbi:MAG: hypothetical protein DLM72_19465 [Candidatus Nitrosopolaris wilkensis]|nr:MAG: hypothetical protein DLM72_19465 [Candidatus Nitrosopolaris wilkensis]